MNLGDVGQFLIGLGTVGNFVMIAVNTRSGRVRGAKIESKLEEVHQSTNGLSIRNELIAKRLGIAEGVAQERADVASAEQSGPRPP